MCLKCIILVTNVQKSPSAGRISALSALNIRCWLGLPEVLRFGQIVVFQTDYEELEL